MASTLLARQLADTHRARQLAVRATTLSRLAVAMRLLDPAAVDTSFPTYAVAASAVLRAGQADSAALALGFYESFRLLELERPAPARVSALAAAPVEFPPAQELAVLRITGPITIKQQTNAGNAYGATRSAYLRTARAVGSLTLNAGRQRLDDAIRADARCIGWQRVTSSAACEFCAMLAGRGAVYKEDTIDFETHAHCGCSGEPVFRDVDDSYPPAQPTEVTEDSGSFDEQLPAVAA